jgi:hypothetical protein
MGGWKQARNNILRDTPRNKEIGHKKDKKAKRNIQESTSTWEDSCKEALITVSSFDEGPEEVTYAELSCDHVTMIQKEMNG